MKNELPFEEQLKLYKELAMAVVLQAAYDYKENESKFLKAKSFVGQNLARRELRSIEGFFYSQRFKLFSNMDGRYLFKLVKEVCQPKKRGRKSDKHVW